MTARINGITYLRTSADGFLFLAFCFFFAMRFGGFDLVLLLAYLIALITLLSLRRAHQCGQKYIPYAIKSVQRTLQL
jgi:hypothetical protein